MAKMYLESNNGGYDILITDENGHWWYDELIGGWYGDANVYCDGETEKDRINAALKNLRREIEKNTYSADEWLEEFADERESIQAYDGKRTIEEIDNIVNYVDDPYSGNHLPLNHDVTSWYEV